ncbi:deoxyguanosinetriphosphate triphosphohydrolase [Natronospira bacteriovora]|uniref:Deoxyguanosinetriphosphate triphosphohydrolase n=1 Tax=Natronospira bacteriovora TaxID=3069753 RepID=A0ABU0WBJ7_9GAMM|nr:deoxyguanosinetriphosphate triphosphohydrolase [Natronospira sp. AB-CW4]MDQ2070840.1 deoxyguanosinetriphosphate triphosphohydrolase [Natronospira sp. AB-CW4]
MTDQVGKERVMPRLMDWKRLLSSQRFKDGGRLRPAHEGLPSARTVFHKDHDRLVFSHAFRRLGRKTQVHPMSKNDHIHTRLTHTIEVGSVGRSLGSEIGGWLEDNGVLPNDFNHADIGVITQAACLAHDIGNPPFGHAGEEAIKDWFKENKGLIKDQLSEDELNDFTKFDGNAQGLRTITTIENHLFDGGLRLTLPTIATSIKYPWNSSHAKTKDKFSVFRDQFDVFSRVANELGLIDQGDGKFCRHPLCFLVEAADDICYAIMDLEDGVELELLTFKELYDVFEGLTSDSYDDLMTEHISDRRRIARLRGAAMQSMIDHAVRSFKEHYESIMAGEFSDNLVECGKGVTPEAISAAKNAARNRVFTASRKTQLEIGSFSSIGVLLTAFVKAIVELHDRGEDAMSFRNKRILESMGANKPPRSWTFYDSLLRVTDVISGMTDDHATFLAGQLSGYGK